MNDVKPVVQPKQTLKAFLVQLRIYQTKQSAA